MRRTLALYLLVCAAAVGCGDDPAGIAGPEVAVADPPAPPPGPRLEALERDLASDPAMLELVALGTFPVEDLLAMGYPEESLTPDRVAALIEDVSTRHPELRTLEVEEVPEFARTPFHATWGRGGLELALPPPDMVDEIQARFDRLCNWTRVALGTAQCVGSGLVSAVGPAIGCGTLFGGWTGLGCGTLTYLMVEVPCVGIVVMNHCPGTKQE